MKQKYENAILCRYCSRFNVIQNRCVNGFDYNKMRFMDGFKETQGPHGEPYHKLVLENDFKFL